MSRPGGESSKRPALGDASESSEEGELRNHMQPKRQLLLSTDFTPHNIYYVMRENTVNTVVIDTLQEANDATMRGAPLPGEFYTYLPLSADCHIYNFFKKNYFFIDDVTLCFGASYMRRVLCANNPHLCSWTTAANTFKAVWPPMSEVGVQRIIYYVICVHIAHKFRGSDSGLTFSPREAIGMLVYRFLDVDDFLKMEFEVYHNCLNYKFENSSIIRRES